MTKYHHIIKYHHIMTRYHRIMTKYHHIITKYHHIMTKYHYIITKYHHIITKYHHIMTKYHHIITTYHHIMKHLIIRQLWRSIHDQCWTNIYYWWNLTLANSGVNCITCSLSLSLSLSLSAWNVASGHSSHLGKHHLDTKIYLSQ